MKFTWINFHVTNQENSLLEDVFAVISYCCYDFFISNFQVFISFCISLYEIVSNENLWFGIFLDFIIFILGCYLDLLMAFKTRSSISSNHEKCLLIRGSVTSYSPSYEILILLNFDYIKILTQLLFLVFNVTVTLFLLIVYHFC